MNPHPIIRYPSACPRSLGLDPMLEEVGTPGIARVQLPFGDPSWLVTGYEDVRKIYSQKCFGRPGMSQESAPRLTAGLLLQGAIGSHEDEQHIRMRKAVMKELSGERVNKLRTRAEARLEETLDRLARTGPTDYVADVARPFAVEVLCDLIGIPATDGGQLVSWVGALLSDASAGQNGARNAAEAIQELGRYIVAVIRERRRTPSDDLVSGLLAQLEPLNTREIATIVVALVMGGFETTAHMLSKMALRLLSDPPLWQTLTADPERVPAAIEELLRTISIAGGEGIPWMAREATSLAGVDMYPGEYVIPAVGAANRDPNVFPDPDQIVLDRRGKLHLSFGHGSHYCIGSEVARMELEVALGLLVRNHPTARLAVPANEVPWSTGTTVWELAALPIELNARGSL